MYDSVIKTALGLFRVLDFQFTVDGAEHLPDRGGAVLAANHVSYFDFMFIGLAAREKHRLVRFMAKKSIFDNPVAGPLMRGMHHIPVDRSAGASAYAAACQALIDGELVGVFPESTISRAFVPRTFKSGAARMALEADVPLLPVVIWGGQRVFTSGRRPTFRRHVPVTIKVGPAIDVTGAESAVAVTALLHGADDEDGRGGAARLPIAGLGCGLLVAAGLPGRYRADPRGGRTRRGGGDRVPSTQEAESQTALARQAMTAQVTSQTDRRPGVEVLEADGPATAVVLVLHGGKSKSYEPTDPNQLTALRMRPFISLLHRRGRPHGVAVWTVRYRYRGWNGAERSPVADTMWALAEVRRRHGDVPVVVVGHSMGGRTALAVGGDASVRGVCALAPWTEDTDPIIQLAGRTVLIAHGNLDRVTSPRSSREYAKRASQVAARIGYIVVRGDMHAMLFRWRAWHRLAVGFSLGILEIEPMPKRIVRAFNQAAR